MTCASQRPLVNDGTRRTQLPQSSATMAKDFARPIIVIIGLLLFVAVGGIGFLVDQLLRSPGLKRKVNELKAQVNSLEKQVGLLEHAIDDLEYQNDRFSDLNAKLNGTVAELSQANRDFAQLVSQLDKSNAQLKKHNVELANTSVSLEEHNKELKSIVGFMNSTSSGLDQSMEKLTEFLDDGIKFYQSSSLRSLELDYIILIRNWDCDFRYYFLGEEFVTNGDVAIGGDQYQFVQSYIKDRLFDDLCLDLSDWELFMETAFLNGPLESMSTNQLVRGVRMFARQALEFYFPDGGEDNTDGPSWKDWSKADYSCSDLERTFRWT